MADSRRTRRRAASASSSSRPRSATIDGWISDQDKHADYLFRAQGLTHLLEQKGCIYPDLICVFYFNLRYRDNIITTKGKGVPIILDDDIWTNVANSHYGMMLSKSILESRTSILSSPFHPFCFILNNKSIIDNCLFGGFKVEERMIHDLIVWILCPRATNHAQCSEQDLLLLYGLLNHIHIDWPTLISDTMVNAKKYNSYHFPHVLLISRILECKGVSVEGELTHAIQAIGIEIGETTFRQMGFVARGRVIIHKDDDHPEDENDDMDAHMADPVQAATSADAGPSQIPSSSSLTMEGHFPNLSKQLEDMRLFQQTHFEQIYEWQQNHEEFVIDQINDIDTRIGNIENHFNLQPLERPPSLEF
ncbi:hypothetical protein LR48_Vigan650s000200 [Vigna angularis]|uniref:Uncharacterized protein n=1 Tax=Phaseolus angularis TaxID=3914 RepID=A0A0L9TFV1_PHAAN|nr:hypothetical protein LR48_Vigan650s000200 [Vigna angularis]